MVVDTMVYAYALLGVPEYREASTGIFGNDSPVVVLDTLWAELANVFWQWVRRHELDATLAAELMEDAEAMTNRVVSCESLWRPALDLAVEDDHPVYDTLFIALARREGLRVATFDRRMIARFPTWSFEPKA